jgi:hypothetical protein
MIYFSHNTFYCLGPLIQYDPLRRLYLPRGLHGVREYTSIQVTAGVLVSPNLHIYFQIVPPENRSADFSAVTPGPWGQVVTGRRVACPMVLQSAHTYSSSIILPVRA